MAGMAESLPLDLSYHGAKEVLKNAEVRLETYRIIYPPSAFNPTTAATMSLALIGKVLVTELSEDVTASPFVRAGGGGLMISKTLE